MFFQRGRAQPPTSISWLGWLGVALWIGKQDGGAKERLLAFGRVGWVIQTPNQTVTVIYLKVISCYIRIYIYIIYTYIYNTPFKIVPTLHHWLSYPNPIISLSNGEGLWYLQCGPSTGKTGYTSGLPYSKCCPNPEVLLLHIPTLGVNFF